MPTILEVLTGRNVSINSDSVNSGTNTTVRTNIQPDGWTQWRDFNYSTITHIFHAELQKPYRVEKGPKPLEKELIISDERTLETLFLKFLSPTVNYALNDQAGQAFLGEGTRCSDDADWSTISDQWFDYHGYLNLLPGDTKLDAKWRPSMLSDNFNEWQKVVSQVATYMARNCTRYGFILTDTKLVVLRLTRERIDAGMAMSRPQRTTATNFIHQRHSSDISMASTSISGSSYSDSNPENWAYRNPEYAVIDWNANGARLTVKLALWALARMATSGDRHLDYSYPDLDTWRWADGYYVHNSSGVIKTKLSKHDVYQEAGTASEYTGTNIAGGSTQNESEQSNYPQKLPIDGTCVWLLGTPEYVQWRQNQPSTILWISGDPGCGNTTLANFLIDRINRCPSFDDTDYLTIYFFFDWNSKNQSDGASLLSALIHQILQADPALAQTAWKHLRKLDLENLSNIFTNIVSAPKRKFKRLVCAVDALDECETASMTKAIMRVMLQARMTATPSTVGTQALFEVQRKEIEKKPRRPFDNRVEEDTWARYTEVWTELIC
ncbi:hypothetical protein FPRO04_14466 [Fusarium proliferatum]|nr:hypothetical protein FPRO04_14466 [Fusarium proliferatum]